MVQSVPCPIAFPCTSRSRTFSLRFRNWPVPEARNGVPETCVVDVHESSRAAELAGFWHSPNAVYSYVRLHYIRLSVVVQNFARRARSEPDVVSKVH